jgi:hypothetical protein
MQADIPPSKWTSQQVVRFLESVEELSIYAPVFGANKVTGRVLAMMNGTQTVLPHSV